MNIKDVINRDQDALLIVRSGDLREFALSVVNELRASSAPENELYTPKDFAARWHTTVTTLNRWCAAGILSKTLIGGRVYYRDSDLKKHKK